MISRSNYDYFYAGSVLAVAEGHNIPALLTETQGYGYATPHHYKVSEFPEAHRDLVPGQFYPNPWRGGWWRFADQSLRRVWDVYTSNAAGYSNTRPSRLSG